MTFNRRTFFALIFCLVFGIYIVGQQKHGDLYEPDFPYSIEPDKDESKPFDFNVPTYSINGKRVNMDLFRDHILIVTSFDADDEDSQIMLPLWNDFFDKYKNEKRIKLLFINLGDVVSTQGVIRVYKPRYPIYTRAFDLNVYDISNLPVTWIINRDGIIISTHYGAYNWMGPDTESFLQQLMASGS